jgi:hypothetical protein
MLERKDQPRFLAAAVRFLLRETDNMSVLEMLESMSNEITQQVVDEVVGTNICASFNRQLYTHEEGYDGCEAWRQEDKKIDEIVETFYSLELPEDFEE